MYNFIMPSSAEWIESMEIAKVTALSARDVYRFIERGHLTGLQILAFCSAAAGCGANALHVLYDIESLIIKWKSKPIHLTASDLNVTLTELPSLP